MDFFKSINPFGSDDPATVPLSAEAQGQAEETTPINGTIYRTTANLNNSIPEVPDQQPPMPDPMMRRRRNYRKNL
jgi:hypothetical protein